MSDEAPATAESIASLQGDQFAEAFGIPKEAPATPDAPEVEVPEVVETETPETPTPEVVPETGTDVPKEGTEAAPVPDSTPKPITTFKVMDAEGELEIPDLTLEFKANGEMRSFKLDKVVRLAQSGFYNETIIKERDAARTDLGALHAKVSERDEVVTLRDSQIERLLTDRDYLAAAQEALENFNHPEARAQRAEAEVKAVRQKDAQVKQDKEIVEFVSSRIMPTYDGLLQDNSHVTPEELWGRFSMLTAPLQVRGVIPPERRAQVEKILKEDIGPWVAHLQEHRSGQAKEVAAKTDTAVRKAQEQTTLAKRTLAKAVKPAGTKTVAPAKAKAPVSANDAVLDIQAMLEGR